MVKIYDCVFNAFSALIYIGIRGHNRLVHAIRQSYHANRPIIMYFNINRLDFIFPAIYYYHIEDNNRCYVTFFTDA